METGQILLYAVGKSALKTEELSKSYQKALTPEGFIKYGEKVFSEIIERFPRGPYQISIQTIPEPYLIWPNMVKEAGDVENTDKLFSLKEKTATPNLLLPTQNLSNLREDIVEKYLDEVDSGTVSYPLLLKEPHNIARLHEQYHPKGYDNKCSPPNFGFNGNHLYFEKRNYYILDGHHRLAAYELIQNNPVAIVIDYQGPINI